jgi:perosamine synthetase
VILHNQWFNRPEYEAATLRVLRSGHVAQGPEVEAFERELAARFRPDGEAVCVSSGTAALMLALKAFGWERPEAGHPPNETEDARVTEVPTYGCWSLYCAAIKVGDVRLVDVNPHTFSAQGLPDKTSDCGVYVDMYGATSHLSGSSAVNDGQGCFPKYIHDITHRPGPSGGDAAMMSFGATKPLGIGAGGAVLAEGPICREIRELRDYDASRYSDAFNFQMSDIHAAIGRERLRLLDQENAWRKKTAMAYLSATPNRTRIGVHAVSWFGALGGELTIAGRVWYRFVIRLRQVEEAQKRFAAAGIETIVPLRTDELLHRRLGLPPEQFPNAEEIARTTLSLPIWPGMTTEQVSRVADCLATLGDLE